MDAGLIGGIVGSVLGVIGGAIGTYFSVTNTGSPAERSFMIKVSIFFWVAIVLFLALLLTIPKPYNMVMWVFYGILLPVGIIKTNKGLAEIRSRKAQSKDSSPPAGEGRDEGSQ